MSGALFDSSRTRCERVQVGVAGNAEPTFELGQTKQFWALASYSDGATNDVTNSASWQTSNPVVATVSSTGLVTAANRDDVHVLSLRIHRIGPERHRRRFGDVLRAWFQLQQLDYDRSSGFER